MTRRFAFFLPLSLLPAAALADELVFEGLPTVRVDSDGKSTQEHGLSEEGGAKYKCRIVNKGRRYYWASRGNRELIRSDAGDYTYYISPEGTGYVKVFTGKKNPDAKLPFDYLEHFSSELKTLTYWGKKA